MAIKTKEETVKGELVTNEPTTIVEQTEPEVLPDNAILNPSIPMRTKINIASDVATVLSEVLEKQGLTIALNKKEPDKKYVTIEGWEVLGTMLGLTAVSTIIKEIKSKQGVVVGYRARGTIYQDVVIDKGEIVGGTIVSQAEAEADRSGFQTDRFAIASMAQTRALSKAYRMALSWIVKLAGYEGTGAEEMPQYDEKEAKK